MKPLRIGYQPLSPDFSHPGDRRRLVFWAKNRGHSITTDLREKVDVIVLSERADFGAFTGMATKVPLVFDLVDAYLTREGAMDDWLRGTSKVLTGQLSGTPKPFTKFVQNLCSHASAVVCSSPEQLETITSFSKNIHVILDSHEELPMIPFSRKEGIQPKRILWEGMPATLGGVAQIAPALVAAQASGELAFDFVTDPTYFRVLGRYFKRETSTLLKKNLGTIYQRSRIIPWSKENLESAARASNLAIIPINLSSPLQYLKPENRLLIMWRLGLPCLTSPSPSYTRTTNAAGTNTVCNSVSDWKEKILTILSDPDYAEDIVRKGQTYLKENHNSKILLRKWDEVFESVL